MMNNDENTSDKKTDNVGTSYRLPGPQDIEKCRGCPYGGVGFICWDQDGSCMKTDVEKIDSRLRG